jgi:hypothetical protein
MGTAAVSLLAFLIVLGTAFTVMSDVLSLGPRGADNMRASWLEAERMVDSAAYAVSASASSTVTETDVAIVVENRGRSKYPASTFGGWEVVVRYVDTGGTEWLEYMPYSATLQEGAWTVDQIYLDEPSLAAEVYEPGIFNPEEEMVITVRLSELLGVSTTNTVTVATPEGGLSTVFFNG